MENILFKRFKNLVLPAAFLAAIAWAAIAFYQTAHLSRNDVQKIIDGEIGRVEAKMKILILNCQKRGQYLLSALNNGRIDDSRILDSEALIRVENGQIVRYWGEPNLFQYKDLDVGKWLLLARNNRIYFMQKLAQTIFFIKYCLDIDGDFFNSMPLLKNVLTEVKFVHEYLKPEEVKLHYDEGRHLFYYQYFIFHSNHQISLQMRFFLADIQKMLNRKIAMIIVFVLILLILLSFAFYLCKSSRPLWIKMVLYGILAVLGWGMIRLIESKNIEPKMAQFPGGSIFEWLIWTLILTWVVKTCTPKIVSFFIAWPLFNLCLFASYYLIRYTVQSVYFPYANFDFNTNYLALIFILFLLLLMPVFFLMGILTRPKWKPWLVILGCQSILLGVLDFVFHLHWIAIPVWLLVLILAAGGKKSFIRRTLILFLLAVLMFSFVDRNAHQEKKSFIVNNIKPIFSNQNNYAKFMVGEIIKEMPSYYRDICDLFNQATSLQLESIWQRSLAARENIASGILFKSKDGSILNHFLYQIPLLKVKTRYTFPFWTSEDASAELFGKKVSLAVASIGINQGGELIGEIQVQVLDSPELILRSYDEINIFTLNKRIIGRDISYLKLNEHQQILENPFNVNVQNIAGVLKMDQQWLKFKYMDLNFFGYIFRHHGLTYIIFYPDNTLVKKISEMIKIFLFLFLFFLLFNIKETVKINWNSIYYSFSFRVFFMLILISMLTAVIFSIFSLNFQMNASERQFRQIIFERGRTFQNIIFNLIEEKGELNQNHLYLLSRIYNSDINVYQKGQQYLTSNYKKFFSVYVHSNILNQLEQKNQEFILVREKNSVHLFFKIYDYIFGIEFADFSQDILIGKGSFFDFLITLFFLLTIIGFSTAFLSRNKILSPIHTLNEGMRAVEKGELNKFDNIPAEFEIKNLFLGFNAMVEGIKEQTKNVAEISRMKTFVKMGRRVAHEVKNPLTPIKLSAEQILRSLKDKDRDYEEIIKKSVQFIIDETEHLRKVSYGFLDLAKLDEIKVGEFDLKGLIEEELFQLRQIYTNITFLVESNEIESPVKLDPLKIKQLLWNLINNSIEAIGEKQGQIDIIIDRDNSSIVLLVRDNGVGMAPNELELIFNEYYSTKDTGTGLGLFIVKRIVDLHHGTVSIQSRPKKGTEVKIIFPQGKIGGSL